MQLQLLDLRLTSSKHIHLNKPLYIDIYMCARAFTTITRKCILGKFRSYVIVYKTHERKLF